MSEPLLPDGSIVQLGDVELTSRGLAGQVELHLPGSDAMRGAEETSTLFTRSLEHSSFFEQLTVEISSPEEAITHGIAEGRGADETPDAGADLSLTVPGPGDGFGQVLLACDEDGVLTWHRPEESTRTDPAQRSADRVTYHVQTRAVGEPVAAKRGLMGALGRKLFKLLAFRLADQALGTVGDFFVSRWEKAHRPHRLRWFTPENYQTAEGPGLSDADIARISEGPALLFIHGTASQGHKAFGALPPATLQRLHQSYQGRVFAFEHPTLSVTPGENVRWLGAELSRRLPTSRSLNLDVVAHSRGGLVGRVLCERAAAVGVDPGRLCVRNLVMVATPNAGTPLADRAHLDRFMDTFTNLLEFLPDNPATDTLDVLLTLLKQVAVGAMGGLDGLGSMDPQGAFLRDFLNQPAATPAKYRAMEANFEPSPGSPLGRYARDYLTDAVFLNQPNDLVVPTDGVHAANGASPFPIADVVRFEAAESVDHSGFWTRPKALEAFDRWLAG